MTSRKRGGWLSRYASAAAWVVGLLMLAVVVLVALHFTELAELGRLFRSLRPTWLLIAAALQAGTYFCAAAVWRTALVRERRRVGLLGLVRLAFVMLFMNHAFPTAGLSGGVFVARALRRRHIPANVAMGALLIGVMTTYLSYLVAVPISLTVLRVSHAVGTRLLVVSAGCAALAVGIPGGVMWYRSLMTPRRRARLKRLPAVGHVLDAIGRTPTRLLRDRSVLAIATAWQFAELMFDAGTLYAVMAALGVRSAPTAVFGSYVMASAVSQVVPVPLGLGSFEAVLVFTLRLIGQPLEVALAATLIFRGFTFWIPMLPGVFFARQEM